MNIFAVSTAPHICARTLDDRRLVKMCLETAQILSSAAHAEVIEARGREKLYSPAFENHPVVRWACESADHAYWTRALLMELGREFTHRFGKFHASAVQILDAVPAQLWDPVRTNKRWMCPDEGQFCNCTPYKHLPTFEAYRHTLIDKWRRDIESDRPPRWRDRGPPDWLESYIWREPAAAV